MSGKKIIVVALGFKRWGIRIKPEAWITAHPPPRERMQMKFREE